MVRTILMVAVAAVGLGNCAAFGQVIRLSEKAVVEPRQDVRLGNIATVTGTDAATAASLADTVVLPNVQSGRTIRAESVLMAVIAQLGAGDAANKLQLAGSAECQIEIATPVVAGAVVAVAPAPAPVVAAVVPVAATVAASPTVITASVTNTPPVSDPNSLRGLLLTRLEAELSADPEDLGVTFCTESPLLDQAVPAGAAWQFQPLTRTFLGTVNWRADLVQNSRVVQKLMVETHVEKFVKILVATKEITSGAIMTADQFALERVSIDRTMPTLYSDAKELVGLEAERGVAAGTQLDRRDFKRVQMATTGGSITVIFIAGNLKAKMNARAQQNGNLHDQITVLNDQTRQEYQATLIGKGLAVVGGTLTDAQEKTLRETE